MKLTTLARWKSKKKKKIQSLYVLTNFTNFVNISKIGSKFHNYSLTGMISL
jgi:hypothetical protein